MKDSDFWVERFILNLKELITSGYTRMLPVGHWKTINTKNLAKVLLETGGEISVTVNGTVYHCELKKKSLGAGVYRVWLELKRE